MSDSEAKGRRKRKDPESRDFTCKCGKSYLSYAAAYTHVKNKHDLEKEYVNNIKKPEREQLKRGRPKEKKVNSQTYETALLTLTESAILKISIQLEHVFPKTILQGNEERSQRQFQVTLEGLCEQFKRYTGNGMANCSQEVTQFCRKLNKDFPVEIAARIAVAIRCLAIKGDEALPDLQRVDLWRGEHLVNNMLLETYNEWEELQARFTKVEQGSNPQS